MANSNNDERLVAQVVAENSVWAVGREFGPPTLNDDGSSEVLFDFRFNDTSPPVALEVTAIVDGPFIATHMTTLRVNPELDEVASQAAHGKWTIFLESGVHVRSLVPTIGAIIELGVAPDRDHYTEGVISIYLEPGLPSDVLIATISGGGAAHSLRGFTEDLAQAITDNTPKLAAAEGYERHLAIDRVAMLASDPGMTAPPPLPDSIDYLWAIRRSVSASRATPVIWLAPDPAGWKTNGSPWE